MFTQPVNAQLHRIPVELAGLPLDQEMLGRIVEDMQRNAGRHLPTTAWMQAGTDGADHRGRPQWNAAGLAQPWLGFGATPINPEAVFWYYAYLKAIDTLGLTDRYFESETRWKPGTSDLLVADLGTIVDLGLVCPFLDRPDSGHLRVVEVGGGYGRLAEAFLNVFAGRVKYVLVDAVPASLAFAYEYMTRCNPDLRVGFYYRDDPLDLGRFDCYILPAWHAEALNGFAFDLAVNVQSMQEMEQHHVDYYLGWFDSLLRTETGIAYFCNRRDHEFRGEWRYPDHWECLLKQCTPRSWTRDFPAEVYRKGIRSYSGENRLREALYRRDLERGADAVIQTARQLGYRAY